MWFDLLFVNDPGDRDREWVPHLAPVLARSRALVSARRTITGTIALRYGALARTSSIGRAAAAAACAACSILASSAAEPRRTCSASAARTHVGATAVSAIRASTQRPAWSTRIIAAAPTTAISIASRYSSRV